MNIVAAEKDIRIIVVEDYESTSELLKECLDFLHGKGQIKEWEVCSSAEKAWERIVAQEGNLDVVFTDVHMLGMGGLALVDRVKKEFPHIKCIVASALDCRSEAAACGADDFVRKPYDPTQIGEIARRVLAGAAK